MAEQVTSFEFPPRVGGGFYPWDQWLDGGIWKVVRGVDFNVDDLNSVRAAAYTAARVRGLKVRTARLDDDTLVIQAVKP